MCVCARVYTQRVSLCWNLESNNWTMQHKENFATVEVYHAGQHSFKRKCDKAEDFKAAEFKSACDQRQTRPRSLLLWQQLLGQWHNSLRLKIQKCKQWNLYFESKRKVGREGEWKVAPAKQLIQQDPRRWLFQSERNPPQQNQTKTGGGLFISNCQPYGDPSAGGFKQAHPDMTLLRVTTPNLMNPTTQLGNQNFTQYVYVHSSTPTEA